jgi:hypothetical protein
VTAVRTEADPELDMDARVDQIVKPWERREGARGTLSNAEMHARSVVNAAREAVRALLERQDAGLKEAVEKAVEDVRLEVGGLNEALTVANTELSETVELQGTLLERLGMSHLVASQIAVELRQAITTVVITPGGGTVGAGSASYNVGSVVVVYNAGFEPSVEIANSGRTSVVSYLVGDGGLTSPQLDAIGTLFGTPITVDQPPPEEAAHEAVPCFEG